MTAESDSSAAKLARLESALMHLAKLGARFDVVNGGTVYRENALDVVSLTLLAVEVGWRDPGPPAEPEPMEAAWLRFYPTTDAQERSDEKSNKAQLRYSAAEIRYAFEQGYRVARLPAPPRVEQAKEDG